MTRSLYVAVELSATIIVFNNICTGLFSVEAQYTDMSDNLMEYHIKIVMLGIKPQPLPDSA